MTRSLETRRLLAEIAEQPDVLRRLATRPELVGQVADAILARGSRAVVFVARGSSDHAAVYGRYLLEIRRGLLTSLAAPSTITLYGQGPDLWGTTVIALSQSGAGEDVLTYLRAARARDALTVAVVNELGSPLAGEAEWVLDCAAGPERSVPATKTVTAQFALLAMLEEALAGGEPARALRGLPEAVEEALAQAPPLAARSLAAAASLAVVGRGFAYPVALEAALKLKELAGVHAEAFSAADFAHGPVTIVGADRGVLALDLGGESAGAARAACELAKSRGADPHRLSLGTLAANLPEHLRVFPALARIQRLSLAVAGARGWDPGNPPGLTKVTSTR